MKQSEDHGTTVAVLCSDVLFPGLCNNRCKYVRISRGDFRGPMDESSNPHRHCIGDISTAPTISRSVALASVKLLRFDPSKQGWSLTMLWMGD